MSPRWIFAGLVCVFTLGLLSIPSLDSRADDEELKPITLFNGKNLKGFYTYLGVPRGATQAIGKNRDPQKVFSLVTEDDAPALRISGQINGAIITEEDYQNYILNIEYKWGKRTYPPRDNSARKSGILLHGEGNDGAHENAWLESIECQLIEGGTGNFSLNQGRAREVSLSSQSEKRASGVYFKPDAEEQLIESGRVYWSGRDSKWTDTLGFRGSKDVEMPIGKWNSLQCSCSGDSIAILLNGKVVNRAYKVNPSRGKIGFKSEGAEIFIRKIELQPLPPPRGT